MSRASKAAEQSLPPEVAPTDTLDEHLMFISGKYSSLPELTRAGSIKKQKSNSMNGQKNEEQSKTSLPFLSLTGYGGSLDGQPRKGMTHTGVVSPAAARRRNKLAAQRALGLSSQSGERQQRRYKSSNNNNLVAEEPNSSPYYMRSQPPLLTSQIKMKAALDVVSSSMHLTKGKATISSTGELIDSVEDLIEDVVLKEDEQLCGSAVEHIAEKIVSLPVLVCYGSNSVVLMDTKRTAAVLREKRMQKMAGNGADSRRLMSPAVPERLAIPAHWPGEPEWLLKQQQAAAEQDSFEPDAPSPEAGLRFNKECKEPLQIPSVSTPKSAMQGRNGPTRRKSFRKAVFEDEEQKLAFVNTLSQIGSPQLTPGPSSSKPGLKFKHPHNALWMSAKAMKRKASAERWKTPQNLVQYVKKEDSSSDEEQDVASGYAALPVASLRNVTGWDPLDQDKDEEVQDSAPLHPRNDELGGFTDYENEDEESREERWAAELSRFDLLADKLELPKHEDYCYSGLFGRPTAQFAEQHRYVRHLMKCNPVAFDAEAAHIQEQALRQELKSAKETASNSMYKPGRDVDKIHPLFMKQLQELKSTRPALVWPDLHRIKREKAHQRSRDRNGHAKKWEFINSIFAARYKDYTPNFDDIVEDHLMFDFERQSNEFYSRFTKKPVTNRNHPSCKERIDMVADALHKAEVYVPLCQAFYSYAMSDPLGPDEEYLLSFEGFESALKQMGFLRVVEHEIQRRATDGEIPIQYISFRETANMESVDDDERLMDQEINVATLPDRSAGSFSFEKMQQALSGGEGKDAVDLANWKACMLVKLFRPSPLDRRTEERAKTPTVEDLTFRELRELQGSGKEGAKQAMESTDDDTATRRRHPINRTEWMDCCMEIAALKYIHRDERFRGKDPTTSDHVEALKFFLERDLRTSMPPYVFANVENSRKSFYTGKVELLLRLNHELIKAMFEMYKAKDRTANLRLDHWMHLMSDLKIVGDRLGITELQAKLLFIESSMAVTPPTREYIKEPTLRIHDFLEALARLADAIWLPTPEDMKSGYKIEPITKDPDPGFHLCDFVLHAPVQALHRVELRQSRTSDTERSRPSRPLHENLSRLFMYITGTLCRYWDLDSCSTVELVDHLHAVRATVWRWGVHTQASFRANKSMLPSGSEGRDQEGDKGSARGL